MSGNLYGKGISTIPYLTPTDSTIGNISISTMGNTKIIPRVIKVTGITLNKATLALAPTETGTLVATVSPNNADTKTVTWSSSDETVATVSNGVVTPLAEGTVSITVTTTDGGFTATCAVTVAGAE